MRYFILPIILLNFFLSGIAQQDSTTIIVADSSNNEEELNFSNPRQLEIAEIIVNGPQFLDKNVLVMLSGLSVGEKIIIPGDRISDAIRKLWKQGLFTNIQLIATKVEDGKIWLQFNLEERPRLSKFTFRGIKKSEIDDLREKIAIVKGQVLTQNVIKLAESKIKDYFIDKGFYNVDINMVERADSLVANSVTLFININKGSKVKIRQIEIEGNQLLSDAKVRKAMKETKQKRWYGLFKPSKFQEPLYEEDLKKIVVAYNAKGFRDARVVSDSIYKIDNKLIGIKIKVFEGQKFYFRNINFVGNSKYTAAQLNAVLGINKGNVYNQALLDERLNMSQNNRDITSLYMDDGYLFFQVNPVEVNVEGDSIDLEIRINEGKQARINRITVLGNTKTNDKVIMRELRTRPGELFSRSDIIRTQRELSQLGYFNPEKMNVIPKPNPADGTVDIDYIVEEKPSDQIELSGGFGAGQIIGTLGVSFNNFSTRNFFKKNAWRPLPAGDGQRLSVRAQSTGRFFQSYNLSFTEPWLGGKRPNSLTASIFYSLQSNGEKRDSENRQFIGITGFSLGYGRQLKVPDDYFSLYAELSLQQYELKRWPQFIFSTGLSNNYSVRISISRNSIDAPIFPRSGSQTTLTVKATPPYSTTGIVPIDFSTATVQDVYRWAEYHKWKFTSSWFMPLHKNVVLYSKIGLGFLGFYNKRIGATPFERFYLGGSGLTNFALDGREIIALRGYDDNSLSPQTGGTFINKYTSEMRFLVSPNPNATVYLLGFVEGGNTWNRFVDFNPFDIYKSAGVGVRIFLPMFGMLGLDWGRRFDDVLRVPGMQRSQVHFTIGFNMGEL